MPGLLVNPFGLPRDNIAFSKLKTYLLPPMYDLSIRHQPLPRQRLDFPPHAHQPLPLLYLTYMRLVCQSQPLRH